MYSAGTKFPPRAPMATGPTIRGMDPSRVLDGSGFQQSQLEWFLCKYNAQCLKGIHVNAQVYNNTQCPVVLCSMPSFSFAEEVKAFVENKSGEQEMTKPHAYGLT